jgi:hypothetical protein
VSEYPAAQPPAFQPPPPQHPQTTLILVLGICSLVLCQVLGPFAWVMGNKAIREIDASRGQYAGRDTVNIGRILGAVATALLVIGILVLVAVIVVAVVVESSGTTTEFNS